MCFNEETLKIACDLSFMTSDHRNSSIESANKRVFIVNISPGMLISVTSVYAVKSFTSKLTKTSFALRISQAETPDLTNLTLSLDTRVRKP